MFSMSKPVEILSKLAFLKNGDPNGIVFAAPSPQTSVCGLSSNPTGSNPEVRIQKNSRLRRSFFGDPNGIRTRIVAVRGRCPNR